MLRLLKNSLLLAVLTLTVAGYAQESSTVWDGVYSEEQASRGEGIYTQACLSCHGQDLGGNSNAPGLTGMAFMFLWEGRTVGELFTNISSEMPTDRPGQLPVQDYLDVLAYILQKNTFPAADRELPVEIEALQRIDISSIN